MAIDAKFAFSIASVATVLFLYLIILDTTFLATQPRLQVPTKVNSRQPLFPTNVGFLGSVKTGTPSVLRQTDPQDGPPLTIVRDYKVKGQKEGERIEENWGALSPYFVGPGFGIEEKALPATCRVKQVHYLHRHGSRYPTEGSPLVRFAQKINDAPDFSASGKLKDLNHWNYSLGEAILVPIGRQQLYDSGVLAAMQYGTLYDENRRIVVRTTSQMRMTQSALAFLNGFFGPNWNDFADLEVIIEWPGFNNTLAPYLSCPNSNKPRTGQIGSRNQHRWEQIFLANKTEEFAKLVKGVTWTIADTSALMTLCPYETIAHGYSSFCTLFSMQEWKDFSYGNDIWFAQNAVFGAPTGRAQGIGYVNELIRRIERTSFDKTTQSSENATLDTSDTYFPLDQDLYFDFTHDSVIASVVAALGLEQFSRHLPYDGPPKDGMRFESTALVPFAARFVFEVLTCEGVDYIHLSANGRTISLAADGDGYQTGDGWSRLDQWLSAMALRNEKAQWQFACFGDYPINGPTVFLFQDIANAQVTLLMDGPTSCWTSRFKSFTMTWSDSLYILKAS